MFTIEHEFDASVITLVDEGKVNLLEDVVITLFEDSVAITQFDTRSDSLQTITLSTAQLDDLKAALNLPEGTYRRGDRA